MKSSMLGRLPRRAALVVAWATLFSGTLIVRGWVESGSHSSKSASVAAADVEMELEIELESKPRKNQDLIIANIGPESDFLVRLRSEMMAHDKGLRRCREILMATATRPREFFEISFVPRKTEPQTHAWLDDVQLERATTEAGSVLEQCIVDEFRLLTVAADLSPLVTGRINFRFCFGNLNT